MVLSLLGGITWNTTWLKMMCQDKSIKFLCYFPLIKLYLCLCSALIHGTCLLISLVHHSSLQLFAVWSFTLSYSVWLSEKKMFPTRLLDSSFSVCSTNECSCKRSSYLSRTAKSFCCSRAWTNVIRKCLLLRRVENRVMPSSMLGLVVLVAWWQRGD